ncbi:MAG: hypothetical protein AAF938_23875 [Myxococcota bacterium]
MRLLAILFSLAALGCGNDVNRIDGEGCQPACTVQMIEGDDVVTSVCLDEDERSTPCSETGQITPVCAGGRVTCDTESGLPECEGAIEANRQPFCAR